MVPVATPIPATASVASLSILAATLSFFSSLFAPCLTLFFFSFGCFE
jgi:hypothetical protein